MASLKNHEFLLRNRLPELVLVENKRAFKTSVKKNEDLVFHSSAFGVEHLIFLHTSFERSLEVVRIPPLAALFAATLEGWGLRAFPTQRIATTIRRRMATNRTEEPEQGLNFPVEHARIKWCIRVHDGVDLLFSGSSVNIVFFCSREKKKEFSII